ncbi:Bax inhibitor-1/YccA family protein [Emcibacter sp.]|uniref:Bax inhibitor-1/YccA family protein n=1 Tax=Emcibacter sp. TaxID=1979954 RepID=UPI002AA8BB6E|nr:Bax inhibitor-1/YccA family protein [Emcibacter sp.]
MVERNTHYSQTGVQTAAQIDAGLRSYMLTVYNYMAIALAVTGFVALGASQSMELMQLIYTTPLQWVVMLAPLGMVFFFGRALNSFSVTGAQMFFWAFAALMGLSMSYIFLVYTGASVAKTFFVTAAAFGSLSLYGYTTKKSLSAMGSFLIMGLFGLIIAMVVNIFLQSAMMDFVISAGGVLIFAGLTAYDTQKIKLMYLESDHSDVASKKAIMGALSLYLDFINMFLFLLRFMGNRN